MSQTAARLFTPAATDRRLAALLAPALAPLFARAPSPGLAWAHGPFLHWLIQSARPRAVAATGRPGRATAALHDAAARLQPQPGRAEAPAPADLLLIEDPVDADAAETDFAAWTPYLTSRAVVVLHGAAAQTLFDRLSAAHAHFVFPHARWLGVVAFGGAVPDPVASLCCLRDRADIDACRDRFALLGEAWEAVGAGAELALLRQEIAALRSSSSWRLTAPLRVAVSRLRGSAEMPAVPAPQGSATPVRSAPREAPRVLFAAAEPETPGALYRCARPAAAAADAGWSADWQPLSRVTVAEAGRCDVLVLWRGAWGEQVERLVGAARRAGRRVVLDLDDLLCDPALARPEVIDGIRTGRLDEEAVRAQALRLRQTIAAADALFASTEPLAAHLRVLAPGRPVFVLPNGFDAATHARSRRAVRERRRARSDGLLRIGYAAGTLTHQRDFAVAAPAVAQLLEATPHARLVLFRGRDGNPLFDPAAFPELAACADQIEWRQAVALSDLPDEMARFDINLAPLEVGNPFCEAKSELKYFEAALVDVPTIASPTAPMAAAIQHGLSGLLAADSAAWSRALDRLAADGQGRHTLAEAAYRDVLLRFGPQLRTDAVAAALDAVLAG